MDSYIEHANITVENPDATAELLCKLFGWEVRWKGEGIHSGYTVHVGSENSYLALYAQPGNMQVPTASSHNTLTALNHIGVVVDDLKAVEKRAKALNLACHDHADYEPGTRFYTDLPDGLEVEVVSYH